jgi:hypothetical protein
VVFSCSTKYTLTGKFYENAVRKNFTTSKKIAIKMLLTLTSR